MQMDDEENPSVEEVPLPQNYVGELLWVATRTRPEVSFIGAECLVASSLGGQIGPDDLELSALTP